MLSTNDNLENIKGLNVNEFKNFNNNEEKLNDENILRIKKIKKEKIQIEDSLQSKSITSTKDFFIRKTESNYIKKSLTPIKTTRFNNKMSVNKENNYNNINIIKSDILQIENIMKELSYILDYFKTNSIGCMFNSNDFNTSNSNSIVTSSIKIAMSNANKNFQKRIDEIQSKSKINLADYFDKICENAKNQSSLFCEFNTKSNDELIYFMALEIYYTRLFVSKIDDMTFIINMLFNYNFQLKDQIFNFSDTQSRFHQINILLEKIKKYSKSTYSATNIKDGINEEHNLYDHIQNEDLEKIMEFRTLSEFLNFNCKNKLINHIKKLCMNNNDKALQIFSDFISGPLNTNKNLLFKLRNTDDFIENFIMIRKIIQEMFNNLELSNTNYKKNLDKLKLENENLSLKINKITDKDFIEIMNKIFIENKRVFENIKENDSNYTNELYKEIIEINIKNKELTYSNDILIKENFNLLTQLNLYTKKSWNMYKDGLPNFNTNSDECYETILREQFENMKQSFLIKINNLSKEYVSNTISTRNKIEKLSDELNKQKQISNILSYQLKELNFLI